MYVRRLESFSHVDRTTHIIAILFVSVVHNVNIATGGFVPRINKQQKTIDAVRKYILVYDNRLGYDHFRSTVQAKINISYILPKGMTGHDHIISCNFI